MARTVPNITDETDADTDLAAEDDTLPPAYIVTPKEGRRMYDEAVRKYMGMSGEEFLRRWDAGEFHELYDKPGYWYVGYLVDIRSFAEQAP